MLAVQMIQCLVFYDKIIQIIKPLNDKNVNQLIFYLNICYSDHIH